MKKLMMVMLILCSSPAFANDCILSIERFACPGKESEAMAPYKGINPTRANIKIADLAFCNEKAVQHSKILRKRIIKKIIVTPTFQGAVQSPVSQEEPCNLKKSK